MYFYHRLNVIRSLKFSINNINTFSSRLFFSNSFYSEIVLEFSLNHRNTYQATQLNLIMRKKSNVQNVLDKVAKGNISYKGYIIVTCKCRVSLYIVFNIIKNGHYIDKLHTKPYKSWLVIVYNTNLEVSYDQRV